MSNFNPEGLRVAVVSPEAIDPDEWRSLQALHLESLCAQPGVERARAEDIVNWHDPLAYAATRLLPELLVKSGVWNEQIFRHIRVGIVYDGNQPVAGHVVQDATSPSLPKWLGPMRSLESTVKMSIHPALPVPKFGGKRIVHWRESYTHPDFGLEVAVAGLWHVLEEKHPNQKLRAYIYPADPSDAQFRSLCREVRLNRFGAQTKSLKGYMDNHLVTVGEKVGTTQSNIVRLIGYDDPASRLMSK